MNINKVEMNGFKIYFKEENINFPSLMKKLSSNEIKGNSLNSGNILRSVNFIEYENKKFIVKNDREIDQRFEKKALSFIFGPFYSHMIKRLARLTPEQRACTADLYYVAEKCHFRQCVEVSTIHEYIDGEPLTEINESNAQDVKDCIIKLHNAGLASNDIHPGNFIRTPSGELKVIDLSCKGSMKICQANDIITLRNKYNIDIQGHGFVYKLILLKEKLRRLSRKIRGK
ncbi:lipopolysaccharide core heptose(II) kinase RfaY [Kluyvera ascorbata]|uniref:lipopolysaccharide core heptose(II) kinase RfaY n=1 Tax=Kluyvera ascorbata TaxID=51288 RepID=UPI002ABC196C|nr:lipopolysaccharide core heptose(II) kinase RfaY [Kluyvera ascorbata]MDZ4032032.1 lipopolysaccharide core heptose(II) kinase RfaY [Kluyvera ascorbata]